MFHFKNNCRERKKRRKKKHALTCRKSSSLQPASNAAKSLRWRQMLATASAADVGIRREFLKQKLRRNTKSKVAMPNYIASSSIPFFFPVLDDTPLLKSETSRNTKTKTKTKKPRTLSS
jgi:ribosomal protein S26